MSHAQAEVNRSKDILLEVKQEANQRLADLQAELDALQQRVNEQKSIVANIGDARNAYVRDAQQWENAGAPDPEGGRMPTREWMVQTRPGRASSVRVAVPWKRPSDPRYPKRVRRVVHDAESSESDDAPLSARPRKKAPAAGPSQAPEEDVVEMGERTWEERDAALRQRAVSLDSCVDQVFRQLGLEPAAPTPTDALFGSDKNVFQPRNPTFNHTKRTTFDGGANVRARVRFRMEGKYPVAWLDDLHSLHPHHFRGRGDQQGVWQLPGGAPYATDTSMHEYVGGVKIWRVEDDTFRIKFYGPRPMLPGILGGEPEVFAVYAEVPLANATKWNPKAWKLLGSKRHLITFEGHVKKLFPMIMMKLLHMPKELKAQAAEDERVRAWWAKKPVSVYKS
jgi:hypothetical protein